jgi:hypothetical protein
MDAIKIANEVGYKPDISNAFSAYWCLATRAEYDRLLDHIDTFLVGDQKFGFRCYDSDHRAITYSSNSDSSFRVIVERGEQMLVVRVTILMI